MADFNGQIKNYLKIYTADLSLNLPMYITTMYQSLKVKNIIMAVWITEVQH